MSTRASLLLAVLALSAGFAFANTPSGSTILLISETGDGDDNAHRFVDGVVRALDGPQVLSGPALRRAIEAHHSRQARVLRAPSAIVALIKQGRQAFIEGKFRAASRLLQQAQQLADGDPALIAGQPQMRILLQEALLYRAHAELRLHNLTRATAFLRELARAFGDLPVAASRYGPELVRRYQSALGEIRRAPRCSVEVRAQGSAVVHLDHRRLGQAPLKVSLLRHGQHLLYLGGQRLRWIGCSDGPTLTVDLSLDQALHALHAPGGGRIVLRYPSREVQLDKQRDHALALARRLGARRVLLLGDRGGPRRTLEGQLLDAHSGQPLRQARLPVDPPPAPDRLQTFAAYLTLSADTLLPQPNAEAASRRAGPRRGVSVMRWVALGVGLAGLGAGIPLLAMHDRPSCSGPLGVRCPEGPYNTLAAGLSAAIVGGLATAASVTLFVVDARARRRVRVGVGPARIHAALSF